MTPCSALHTPARTLHWISGATARTRAYLCSNIVLGPMHTTLFTNLQVYKTLWTRVSFVKHGHIQRCGVCEDVAKVFSVSQGVEHSFWNLVLLIQCGGGVWMELHACNDANIPENLFGVDRDDPDAFSFCRRHPPHFHRFLALYDQCCKRFSDKNGTVSISWHSSCPVSGALAWGGQAASAERVERHASLACTCFAMTTVVGCLPLASSKVRPRKLVFTTRAYLGMDSYRHTLF